MNNFNNVDKFDKADKYVCPPFKKNCVGQKYDPSIEAYRGIIYSVIICVLFWIGIYLLTKWL